MSQALALSCPLGLLAVYMEGRYGHSKEEKASPIRFGYLTFFFCLWNDMLRGWREAFCQGI